MTYSQIQSFQINDYMNYYVDIEITRCRVLYSESTASRGVTRLISWLGIAVPVDYFNKVFDYYIRVYQSFSILIGKVQPTLVGPTLSYTSETRDSANLKFTCVITLFNWNTVKNTQ